MKLKHCANRTLLASICVLTLFFGLPQPVGAQVNDRAEAVQSGQQTCIETSVTIYTNCLESNNIPINAEGNGAAEGIVVPQEIQAECSTRSSESLVQCFQALTGGASRPDQEISRFPDISDLNPINNIVADSGEQKISILIGRGIRFVLGIFGSIAMGILVLAGLTWMLAMGNASREEEAKDTMFYGALGVIIVLAAYTIVTFIYRAIGITF